MVYPQWDILKDNETVYLCGIPCVAEMGVRKREVWFFQLLRRMGNRGKDKVVFPGVCD